MDKRWSDVAACTSIKVGGFNAMDCATSMSGSLPETYTCLFKQNVIVELAGRLEREYTAEKNQAIMGRVAASEEMAMACTAKKRKTLVKEIEAGKRPLMLERGPAVLALPPPQAPAPLPADDDVELTAPMPIGN